MAASVGHFVLPSLSAARPSVARMTNPHPGDSWPRYCPRSYDQPILVLAGLRSIHAAWPPDAACKSCGIHADGGYVGPVTGNDIAYPAPAARFFCRVCARASLGLVGSDWTSHSCRPECGDTEHVDWISLARDELVDSPPAGRIAQFSDTVRAAASVVNGDMLRRPSPWAVKLL
jgi:hypothetical protein